MPADKVKIYISSTFSDLIDFRETVYHTLRQMEHDVVAMEDYVATDQRPLAKCVADVTACDVYVGIFAWRYGYIPADDNPLQKSITELEYLAAEKHKKPRLIFLLREDAEWPDAKRDAVTGDGENGARIAAFRRELGTDHLASFFRSPDELAKLVNIAVTKTLKTLRTPFMAEPLGEFVQRPAEYDALLAILLDEDRTAPVAITAALRGAGGFGKTTLARALCHDPKVHAAFADGVLWVTLGENPTNILGSVEDLIFTLEDQRPGFTNVQAAANRLKELLAHRAVLLVIDDVWNNAHLTPFLLGGERCAYLITTRNSDTLPAATKQIPVDAMQQREAVAMLAAGLSSAEQHDDQLRALAGRLGEWPLLLKLVNGTLRDRVNNTRADVAAAIDYANRALDKRGLTFFDVRKAEERHQAVALTLGVSLDLLTDDERARYHALAVFPEDVEIPLPTLEKYWGLDDFTTEEICTRLMQMSLLLSYDSTTQRIRLHDVFRHFLIGQQADQMPGLHQKLLDSHCSVAPSLRLVRLAR